MQKASLNKSVSKRKKTKERKERRKGEREGGRVKEKRFRERERETITTGMMPQQITAALPCAKLGLPRIKL